METNKENRWKQRFKEFLGWFIILAVAFTISQLLTHYVIVNANIPSESMQNTIMKGDKLLANRLSYMNSEPQRGDIVVFQYPVDESLLYIKRVIGLPNDKVEIIAGKIYINDSEEPLKEDYLSEEWVVNNDGYTFVVPEDHYLMLGDNRNNSSDARSWKDIALEKGVADTEQQAEAFQYVDKDKIVGKAFFRYWPLREIRVF